MKLLFGPEPQLYLILSVQEDLINLNWNTVYQHSSFSNDYVNKVDKLHSSQINNKYIQK